MSQSLPAHLLLVHGNGPNGSGCGSTAGASPHRHTDRNEPTNLADPVKQPQIGAKHRQVIGPRTLVVCPRLGGPEEPHVQRVLARLRAVRG